MKRDEKRYLKSREKKWQLTSPIAASCLPATEDGSRIRSELVSTTHWALAVGAAAEARRTSAAAVARAPQRPRREEDEEEEGEVVIVIPALSVWMGVLFICFF